MVTEQEIWSALGDVMDPELPISVIDLGIVRDVALDDRRVRVRLIPTYSACPAIEVMRRDIRSRLLALSEVDEVTVDLTFDEPWRMARMSEEGRRRLREFGLSLPRRRMVEPAVCPFCGSTDTVLESPFGPTLCRAIYYCRACRNPIERFKPPGQ